MSRLTNLIEALEQKLGNLALYENELIKEAEILKSMYEGIAEKVNRIDESIKQFEKEKYCFFRDFDEQIESSMAIGLRNLLNTYNINVTLSKGESND